VKLPFLHNFGAKSRRFDFFVGEFYTIPLPALAKHELARAGLLILGFSFQLFNILVLNPLD